MWTQDNDKRMNRRYGWNDITDAYWGKLPDDWPYESKTVDPRIRTSIVEKNARLLNNRLRGRLTPREGGDMISAEINNALLDYQWDTANEGGSMMVKMSIADMDTRLYGSKFAYIYWKHEEEKGEVTFDGNEMMLLDIRDCGIDPTASHIKDAKWFQMRTWEKLEDLENAVDVKGNKIYKNLGKVKRALQNKQNRRSSQRSTEYNSRIKQIQGMEDRIGDDMAYPIVKKCVEFRKDKWIHFLPDFDLIIKEEPNPFDHGRIPIAQLRYYALQDDPIGESEVEPVLPLWKGIQATVCGYMDESILKMRPPIKIIENAARIETIEYGPEAQWLVDRPDAIEEMKSFGDSLQYFQTTYSTLVAAFNIAMGDLSQGNSNLDPFQSDPKTATEIRASLKQQSVRDQKNQNDLVEFIKDVMMMWLSNNKQFLFADRSKREHILKVIGDDKFGMLQRMGLADSELVPGADEAIMDIIDQDPNIGDAELLEIMESASVPKHPTILNPEEKDINKIEMKPKMEIDDTGRMAEISIVPKDLEGTYDYIPDVRSMSVGAGQEMIFARQKAIDRLTGNQVVLQLLQQEGWMPKVKELLSADFEETGLRDAEKYFEKISPGAPAQGQTPTGAQAMGGPVPPSINGGIPNVSEAPTPGSLSAQMAQPAGGPNPTGIS